MIKSNLFLQTKFLLRVISAVLGGDRTEPTHMLSAQFCKTRERERERKSVTFIAAETEEKLPSLFGQSLVY